MLERSCRRIASGTHGNIAGLFVLVASLPQSSWTNATGKSVRHPTGRPHATQRLDAERAGLLAIRCPCRKPLRANSFRTIIRLGLSPGTRAPGSKRPMRWIRRRRSRRNHGRPGHDTRAGRAPPTRSTSHDITPPRGVPQGAEGRPRPARHRRRPGPCPAGDSLRGIAHVANRDLAAPTAAISSRAPPHRHTASTAPHPPRARDTDRRSRIRRVQCGCA